MSNPVKKFEIHLEHDIDEQYQYEPGEVLRGKVIISTSQNNVRIKAILIQVKGEATVSWSLFDETSGAGGGGGGGEADQISASETYVDKTFAVVGSVGSEIDSPPIQLSRGDHSYPFEYTLPSNLPSSFIGKYGNVTYVVKATLKEDKLGGFGTTISSEPFLVLRPIDIGSNPILRQKRSTKLSKRTVGLLMCLFGKTSAEFSVIRTGFLPGEELIIDADVKNEGRDSIKSIQAAVVMTSSFNAKKITKKNTQVITKKMDNTEVEYGGSRKWTGIRLSIPSYIPESRLDGCDMIDIEYELQFRLEMANGSDVRAKIPLVIGTPKNDKNKREWSNNEVENRNGGNGGGGGMMMEMEDDMEKFRHPMVPGETRQNILFEGNME